MCKHVHVELLHCSRCLVNSVSFYTTPTIVNITVKTCANAWCLRINQWMSDMPGEGRTGEGLISVQLWLLPLDGRYTSWLRSSVVSTIDYPFTQLWLSTLWLRIYCTICQNHVNGLINFSFILFVNLTGFNKDWRWPFLLICGSNKTTFIIMQHGIDCFHSTVIDYV